MLPLRSCARGLCRRRLAAFKGGRPGPNVIGWGLLVGVTALMMQIGVARAESLDQALTDAYKLNQQIAAQRAALQGAAEKVPQAKANLWRPHISLSEQATETRTLEDLQTKTSYGPSVHYNYTLEQDNVVGNQLVSINTLITLYDSGQTFAQVRYAKALIKVEAGILAQTEQNVFVSVAQAYGQVVLNQLLRDLALEQEDDLSGLRTEVHAIVRQHLVTVGEVAQVDAQYASAQASYDQAIGNLDAARDQFLAVVGRPAGKITAWPSLPPLPPSLDAAIAIAQRQNPQIYSARYQVAANQAAADAAFDNLLPVVSLVSTVSKANIGTHYTASNVGAIPSGAGTGLPPYRTYESSTAFEIGLQLTWPLYEGGSAYALIRQQRQAVDQAQSTLIDTDRSVIGSVRSEWHQLIAAKAQIVSSKAQVAAARIALTGAERQYRDGTTTITNVIQQRQNLNTAVTTFDQANYNYLISTVQFFSAIGRYNAKALDLPVKLYDPLRYYNEVKDLWFGFGP
jgi:outer membrane protein